MGENDVAPKFTPEQITALANSIDANPAFAEDRWIAACGQAGRELDSKLRPLRLHSLDIIDRETPGKTPEGFNGGLNPESHKRIDIVGKAVDTCKKSFGR